MRFLHRVFLLGNRSIMQPLVRAMGGPRDTTLGGRLCLLRTVGRKSGIVREVPLGELPPWAVRCP
jgi:hypothetical protein